MPLTLPLLFFFFQSPGEWQRRGEDAFRAGKYKESVEAFDKVLAAMPQEAPHHWQRGISLYYAGRFVECRDQFALHRSVNPEDFENAAFHMLCSARVDGFAKAQKELIPIKADSRQGMHEQYLLWKGQGSANEVLRAAGSNRTAQFYANLYLALFEETRGKRNDSKKYAKLANDLAGPDDMGDVARAHWRELSAGKLP